MNIDDLTIGDAKKLAALFCDEQKKPAQQQTSKDKIPVVVCTDKRGVVFGYTTDTAARPITLTDARMCLYWSKDVGGVFGLGGIGPTVDCRISATLDSLDLEGVTAVFSVSEEAEKAWTRAAVQGR